MVLSTKAKIRLSQVLLVILLLAICGTWAYYKFYVKTPEYAIKSTVNAIETHDWKKFQDNVDVDTVANSVAEPLLMGAIEAQGPVPAEAKEMLANWIKMFKAPVTLSIKEGIQHYVQEGNWNVTQQSEDSDGAIIDPRAILEQIGITDLSFIKVDGVTKDDKDATVAYVKAIVKQSNIDKEFPLELRLQAGGDGYWKIVAIDNFKEFITFVQKTQKEQMEAYLKKSAELYAKEGASIKGNEDKLAGLLAAGTLGNDKTRGELQDLLDKDVIPQLQRFKGELQAIKAPGAATTLQNLRLQILDNKIAYYAAYSKWLKDKNIDDLRKATDSLGKYQAMEEDAQALEQRIAAQVQQ